MYGIVLSKVGYILSINSLCESLINGGTFGLIQKLAQNYYKIFHK